MTTRMTKRTVVAAMLAAQDCIGRLERGQTLPTAQLRAIALVTGDDTDRLTQLDKSGFKAPTHRVEMNGELVEQRTLAIAFLTDFLDDCRFMLRESGQAEARRG